MFKNLDLASLRREVAAEVRGRTGAFADKHYGKQEEAAKPKKSEKVTKLNELLATGAFGCNSSSVAKALSIVLGDEVTYDRASGSNEPRIDPFPFGIAIVPSAQSGSSHVDKALLNGDSSDSKTFMDSTGVRVGVSGRKVNSRPATAKEIDALVASLPDASVLRIAANMLANQPKA